MINKKYDPHKELFEVQGEERYRLIGHLPVRDISYICGFYKRCAICPLALYHADGHGFCADIATSTDVLQAIKYGAEFVKKEDFENEKNV